MEITLAIGAILGALIALLGNRLLENRKESNREIQLVNSLFGELLHVLQHYHYSNYSIEEKPLTADEILDLRKRLEFTRYGNFVSAQEISRYGFLSKEEVKNLLQLAFRIRNTDYLLDIVLERPDKITSSQFNEIQSRAQFICKSTEHILNFIADKREPYLKAINIVKSSDYVT